MGAAFTLNKVRVTVDTRKLEQICQILGVSPAQKARIIKDGVVLRAPSGASGGAAKRPARSTTARSTAASRSGGSSTGRSTARTPRRRK